MATATFTADLAKRNVNIRAWLELEGCPSAFGTFSADSTWFAARTAPNQFDEILPYLADDGFPRGADQEINVFEGSASAGQWEIHVVDAEPTGAAAGSFTLLASVRRTDLRMKTGAAWSDTATGNLAYSDPFGVDGSWASSGYLWVDREVLHYDSINTGANTVHIDGRGYYRTDAREHATSRVIVPYPNFLNTRRAWFYIVLNNGTDADKLARMSGEVTDSKLQEGLGVYTVTVSSVDKRMGGWLPGATTRKQLFDNQKTGNLAEGVIGDPSA